MFLHSMLNAIYLIASRGTAVKYASVQLENRSHALNLKDKLCASSGFCDPQLFDSPPFTGRYLVYLYSFLV